MKRRLIQLALGMLISAALIVLLARTVDIQAVGSAVAAADMRLIALGVVLHLLAMLIRSALWRRLLAVPVPIGTLFKASIVGFAISYILPLRVGEIGRAYLLARWRGIAFGTSLASLVAERVLDGLAVGGLLLLAILFVTAPGYVLALGLIVGGLFSGMAMALALVTWRADMILTIASTVGHFLPERIAALVMRLARSFASGLQPLRDWRRLPISIGLCLAGWLCQFAVFYLVMLAFALPASVPMALVSGGVANFATLLPSAPGNVGTFDAAIVKLSTDIQGVSLAHATAYALTLHTVVVLPIVILGGVVLWRSNLTLGQVLARGLRPQPAAVSSKGAAAAALNTY
jgi:uncharacterized protein (TIRG00374 family)